MIVFNLSQLDFRRSYLHSLAEKTHTRANWVDLPRIAHLVTADSKTSVHILQDTLLDSTKYFPRDTICKHCILFCSSSFKSHWRHPEYPTPRWAFCVCFWWYVSPGLSSPICHFLSEAEMRWGARERRWKTIWSRLYFTKAGAWVTVLFLCSTNGFWQSTSQSMTFALLLRFGHRKFWGYLWQKALCLYI